MTIRFEDESVPVERGDTIATALYRHGLRQFGVSFAYRRPRGLLCASGNCANCQVIVDGIPNVYACQTAVREGMTVRRQMDASGAPPTHGIGLGTVPPVDGKTLAYEHRHATAEVAIIGAGREGIQAALEEAGNGSSVWLIEKEPQLGGRLRWTDPSEAASLSAALAESSISSSLTILKHASCSGLYEGNLLAIVEQNPSPGIAERLLHLRAKRIIVATGSYEVPLNFSNNDLPGIMLSSGVLRLIHLHGIVPGSRAVLTGLTRKTQSVARSLREAGCDVVRILPADALRSAEGSGRVERVLTSDGEISCDLLVLCGPRFPDAGLLTQAGGKLTWSERNGHYTLENLKPGIAWQPDEFCLGPIMGSIPRQAENEFICTCHDVTSRDLQMVTDAGFTHIETVKRITKAMKGQCQGRMCTLGVISHCAKALGSSFAEVGTTISRPPSPAISLGALAGSHSPLTRLTPLHAIHEALGAVWIDMAGWKRPKYYRRSAVEKRECELQEYKAVRERVGVIDVSTLGKLLVKGSDAGWLLDRCYTHHFSRLQPGRARYALMCDEAGTVLDDGMIARCGSEEFFVTTTTSNVESIHRILEWQLAGGSRRAAVVNVTAGLAAINVTGPLARQVLQTLTDVDLSASGFPYMHCRRGQVAEVPALLLRSGFVGEVGWEIHYPSAYGEELWQRIFAAGERFGIQPVGVETQRLLRLEKKHIIVGVDTDALTTPYSAGMDWVVKLDKEDFLGRAMLRDLSIRPALDRLVGFTSSTLPYEGAAVVHESHPVGRVTSARYSPHNGMSIGLAWVPRHLATDGTSFEIQTGANRISARVHDDAFYDSAGTRFQG